MHLTPGNHDEAQVKWYIYFTIPLGSFQAK